MSFPRLSKASNEAVIEWLMRFDAELALPTVTIAEIYFRDTKRKTGSACRSVGTGFARLAPSFRGSDFRFEAALAYSEIMGGAALRGGECRHLME